MSDRTPEPDAQEPAAEISSAAQVGSALGRATPAAEPDPTLGEAATAAADQTGTPALEELDGAALRRWAFRARAALAQHRGGIDALNVFPVPDGDTGTNMLATLTGALRGARPGAATTSDPAVGLSPAAPVQAPDDHHETVVDRTPQGHPTSRIEAVARKTLTTARGNSGVILSELLRGLSQVVGAGRARVDGPTLAAALRTASERAWQAVGRPVDGTMLSVARAAAAAADHAARGSGRLVDVTGAAVEGARKALASTPDQLPTLKRAGVVDAGGAGLLVVLSALHDVVTGRRTTDHLPASDRRDDHAPEPHDAQGQFEVMYVVSGLTSTARCRLRDDLDALGDSVVIAGDAHEARVHVHTRAPEAAVACGRTAGAVSDVRSEPLSVPRDSARRTQLVTWLSADVGEGVPGQSLRLDGDGRRAPTTAVLEAVSAASNPPPRSPGTPVLPGESVAWSAGEVILVTDRCEDQARLLDPHLHIVRCTSLPAALAALAVYDGSEEGPVGVERDLGAMRSAAESVRAIELPRGVYSGAVSFANRVDEALAQGGELVTLVAGPDGATQADALERHLRRHPVEVTRVDAPQPLSQGLIIVGVE
ncbi:MAG: DAK2 domain-containing protein [Micrococcales bacterium]|nr:DAK2 domain-containing protein [Micrococcales bacterium]